MFLQRRKGSIDLEQLRSYSQRCQQQHAQEHAAAPAQQGTESGRCRSRTESEQWNAACPATPAVPLLDMQQLGLVCVSETHCEVRPACHSELLVSQKELLQSHCFSGLICGAATR